MHNGLPPQPPGSPSSGGPIQPVWPGPPTAHDQWGEPSGPEINVMEYVTLVWSRKWIVLAVLAVVMVAAAARAFTRPKLYRSFAKVAVQPTPQLSQSRFDAAMNFWQMDRYIADQVEVLRTRQLAQRVAEKLGIGKGDAAAAGLLGRMSVSTMEGTDVITISMVGLDPERVSEWLNVYVHEYIAANIEDGLGRTRQIFEVIQDRLEPLREQLVVSEEELVEFREREDALLFADQDKNVISEQVNTLTTEYAQAKAQRIRLETKISALRRIRASNVSEASFPEVLQNLTIQNLREQKGELEGELTDKLRTLKSGHPLIQELRSRLDSIDARIRTEIDTIRTSLQTDFDIARQREQSLFSNIQQLKVQSIELSKQTLEYERLKRQYDQNKAFLEDMLARSNEADISSSTQGLNNVRIIEPARPARFPYSPNIRRTLAVSFVLGLFLGVGLVLGLDFLDNTLRTPDQVERYLGIEVLTAVPKFTEENARVLRESFQSLRTAVMLASRGEGCQVLMVTSAVPSEGKTTVVFNLGNVLAAAGARVLLIDADLRKPRLHRIIKERNVRGLTSVVLGERELDEVINSVADAPNLDVVTSGPLPPNPPELFGKGSFGALLDQARTRYDWVIIDTPPVASVTDPVICASMVNMALLVVQYGHAKRQHVVGALRQLARSGARIPGAVLNKIDLERDHYYYYHYYHSSYFRYGYDHDSQSKKKTKTAGKTA